ncbi:MULTISPECIES: glucuronate isomerase [Paenibacillus]|uniref:Uronate isomerase n=1 Tax=Paenibacillus campinasensis TaxID=66347 RepID=A0ABW9T1B7_9BACL|nr:MULTISPECIES: glucuronate isomerase [Paenibacillus]MUG66697.1 glucuronate isomerase [Paenibacillus campinasensis]PAK54678.1 glucuronate isomerase [Paenibacillus sp. 7541]
MKPFMDEDFMLHSSTAQTLYHDYAKKMPIIDYHCHLSPQLIYENHRFRSLTEAWIDGDHYKWRAMRANGVREELITGGGGASDYDRFLAWAKTVPMTLGNPLFHWSHLELRRIFGIDDIISEKTAPHIWEQANARLAEDDMTTRGLIKSSNVQVVCTTDDPTDTLEYHIKLSKEDAPGFRMLPSFRPDKGLEINRDTFVPWVAKLAESSGITISDYDSFLKALESRAQFFHSVGGRVSDHALDYVPYAETTQEEAGAIFLKALQGSGVSREEEVKYKTFTLLHLGKIYARLGWAMQYHINAQRNNNTRMFQTLGPDTGYDSIGDAPLATPLVRLLDRLDQEQALPRTILYSLNPRDNDILAALIGSFQGDGIPGKIQFGSAWWFNDTKDGMIDQMSKLGNMGLLSRFVGMLTDSRSFLSYTRHEYFRRIVCNLLGDWVERGEAPHDPAWLGEMVQAICYNNAEAYFRFGASDEAGES